MQRVPGTLYVVATPIGNLSDISPRALEVLRSSDVICCEDTRVFGKLCQAHGIVATKLSYHEQNERERVKEITELLCRGTTVSLVSDAGTPGISDPGYRLIRECRLSGIPISPVPGPCAAIAALSVSGLPTDRFLFEGFLPVKKGRRSTRLLELLQLSITSISYESPHRICDTLAIIHSLAAEREVFVCRELTKTFEQHYFGTAASILEKLKNKNDKRRARGEFVLVISGSKEQCSTSI